MLLVIYLLIYLSIYLFIDLIVLQLRPETRVDEKSVRALCTKKSVNFHLVSPQTI